MRGALAACCAIACLAVAACEGAPPAGSRTGPRDAASTSTAAEDPLRPPTESCSDPTFVNLDRTPVRRLGGDVSGMPVGPPSRVPWVEFVGTPETGRPVTMHVGRRALPLTAEGYLREATVWRTGVVWFQDHGLRLLAFDGGQQRVRGVPAWYDRLTYARDRIYFAKGHDVMSVSADDLTPRALLDVADVVQVPRGLREARVRVVGSLGGLPVWQARFPQAVSEPRSAYFVGEDRQLPVDPRWGVEAGHGRVLTHDPAQRVWAAYGPRGEMLWCRAFHSGDRRPRRLHTPRFTPGGRHVVLGTGDDSAIVLDARTGAVRHRYRTTGGYFGGSLEDDHHVMITAYDGPPNPSYDPRDTFPEPTELTWDNVVVRCTFTGVCEQAGRVPPPGRSVVMGATSLFGR